MFIFNVIYRKCVLIWYNSKVPVDLKAMKLFLRVFNDFTVNFDHDKGTLLALLDLP